MLQHVVACVDAVMPMCLVQHNNVCEGGQMPGMSAQAVQQISHPRLEEPTLPRLGMHALCLAQLTLQFDPYMTGQAAANQIDQEH